MGLAGWILENLMWELLGFLLSSVLAYLGWGRARTIPSWSLILSVPALLAFGCKGGYRAVQALRIESEFRNLRDEYLEIARRFPESPAVGQPFVIDWRPSIGKTDLPEDVRLMISWSTRFRAFALQAMLIRSLKNDHLIQAAVKGLRFWEDGMQSAMHRLSDAIYHGK
jgi:hypothetical protein